MSARTMEFGDINTGCKLREAERQRDALREALLRIDKAMHVWAFDYFGFNPRAPRGAQSWTASVRITRRG